MIAKRVLIDIVRNRLLWLDSHMYAILSWDLIEEKQITVDEFNPNDKGLSGIAVFEVMHNGTAFYSAYTVVTNKP